MVELTMMNINVITDNMSVLCGGLSEESLTRKAPAPITATAGSAWKIGSKLQFKLYPWSLCRLDIHVFTTNPSSQFMSLASRYSAPIFYGSIYIYILSSTKLYFCKKYNQHTPVDPSIHSSIYRSCHRPLSHLWTPLGRLRSPPDLRSLSASGQLSNVCRPSDGEGLNRGTIWKHLKTKQNPAKHRWMT